MENENPWKVMQARQPLWSEQDEKRLTEKRSLEKIRYSNLPETKNEEEVEENEE